MKLVKKIVIFILTIFLLGLLFLFFWPALEKNSHLPNKLLIAHRANTPLFPENSLEGILYLKNNNVTAVEIDIRKTKDSSWVLFHDIDCMRMLGKHGDLAEISYIDLKNHYLLFNNHISLSKIPLFEDVLKRVTDSIIFYIDVKEPSYDRADEIVSLIKENQLEKTAIIASTDASFIFYIKVFYPEVLVALEGFNSGKEFIYSLLPNVMKPDYLSSFYYKTDLNHVNWLKENFLLERKVVYGVDTGSIEKVVNLGYRKIIADYDSLMFFKNK